MAIENVRAVYFPYCLQKQEDGSWVLLNRNYKPIGFNTAGFIKYEEYPVSMKIKGLGPETLKKLSCKGENPSEIVYLYDDGCNPSSSDLAMSKYLEKIAILLKLQSV